MAAIPAREEFSVERRVAMPAHLIIQIKSFSQLAAHGIHEYESGEFVAGDHQWRKTSLYFGGEHVSVDLIAQTESLPPDWELDVIFIFFLYNQISNTWFCFQEKAKHFNIVRPKWRLSNFISKETLINENGYLDHDTCFLGAEVFVSKPRRVIERLVLYKHIYQYFRTFTIENYSTLGDVWTSKKFGDEYCQWQIKLCRLGHGRENAEYVSIYLYCVDLAPKKKVNAEFNLQIRSPLGDCVSSETIDYDWLTADEPFYSWYFFAPTQKMQEKFVFNDCCILRAMVSVRAIVNE